MQTRAFAVRRDDIAALPPLDAEALQRFFGGGAPTLAVGIDPRVPVLPVGERVLQDLGAPPVGLRLTMVLAEPRDGRSTLAVQLVARLAERRELALGWVDRLLPFDAAAASEHLDAARDRGLAPVIVVDDAHECIAELHRFVRSLGRERVADVVLLADAAEWVRGGGEARPWLAAAAEVRTLRGASVGEPDVADPARVARDRGRAAELVLAAVGRDTPAERARFLAALEGRSEADGQSDSSAVTPPVARPELAEGPLGRAHRTVVVGDEDAWRARAEVVYPALAGVQVGDRAAADVLVLLGAPVLVGLAGVPELLLARLLGVPPEAPRASALAVALAPLAAHVPLRRTTTAREHSAWAPAHPIIAGALIDAQVDAGCEPLRAPLTALVDAALAALSEEIERDGRDGSDGRDGRGSDVDPLIRRTARLAAAFTRPPEAVRWLLDDTGSEELAVELARHAAEQAPRVDLAADLATALRRAGRPAESLEVAQRAWAGASQLHGAPENVRRLAVTAAISELRSGGAGAVRGAVAQLLRALADEVPATAGAGYGSASAPTPDEPLPRGPFELALRTLAWLAGDAREADDGALLALLEKLAPFKATLAPERHERDEDSARVEVTRPEDVPLEPEEFGALLADLARLTAEAETTSFQLAVRVYRRFIASRIGPLVRVLPQVAGSVSPGDLLQDSFEGWLAAGGIKPYEAQMEAYFSIFAGQSVLLNTPTGSGKSLVALAAHFNALGRGERSVYTAPTKALVNEKFFDLCRKFGSANVGLLTGDAAVNRDAPVICCTAEILSNLAQVEGTQRPFGWVVMDEFHYFSDKERGIAWLLPLMLLDGAKFLLMSATIGEIFTAEKLVEALTGQDFELVRATERPVPLLFSYKVATEREAINELRDASLLPAYVVCVTRNEAAEKALAEPSSGGWSSKSVELPEYVFTSPFGRQLKRALRAGIGLHHSGLLPKYRRLVENLSAANELRLIFGTDTLGVGVNLPIRTVLFPQLVRNSGKDEYVRLDAARFQQLAGRAGRAGFASKSGDPQGDVWILAPEDEVERQKAAAKAAKGGKAKKPAAKPAGRPGPKMPSWSEQTMQNLAASPARPLEVRFEVTAALVMNFVRRGERGIQRLRDLIELLPVKPAEREALSREVERVLETLVARREVRRIESGDSREAPASAGFSLGERSVRRADDADALTFDRPLLRFLHDVAWDFLAADDGPALDLLSLVESVVDDPRVVLARQAKKLRDELWQAHREQGTDAFDQSARRDFGAERQEIEHPQPLKDEIAAAFDRWDAEHPGLTTQMPSPKSVVRDMFELGMGFREYVQHYGLAVVEGELLRHLCEVWRVLTKGLPPGRDITRGTRELTEWLGALVRHVDSSLIDEWERLDDPDRAATAEAEPLALPYDVTQNARAFTRMVRNAAFRWVRAFAARSFDELANESVPLDALAATQRAFLDECGRIDTGIAARSPSLCEYTHGELRVEQTLADPEGWHEWSFVGEVDLARSREEGDAVLVLRSVGRKGWGSEG